MANQRPKYKYTLGTDNEVNGLIASLTAIMEALAGTEVALNASMRVNQATIYSDNISALRTILNPKRQSGQSLIRHIIKALWNGNTSEKYIRLAWVPRHPDLQGSYSPWELGYCPALGQRLLQVNLRQCPSPGLGYH